MPAKQFNGLQVGSLESRKAQEMTRLIANLKGVPLVVPSMREIPLEENREVLKFGEELLKGQIDILICFTGVGTAVLIKTLTNRFPLTNIKKGLAGLTLVVRGPKPSRVLEEFGLTPTFRIPEPNTWREILKTIDEKIPVDGKTVAVQEYGESNKVFLSELLARGAVVRSLMVYRAVLPEDTGPLKNMVDKIIAGDVDVLLFTNSTQVSNLMDVASQNGRGQELRHNLKHVMVGSVGPTCSETLRSFGVEPDVEPQRTMMGALVALAAEKSSDILATKNKDEEKIIVSPRANPKKNNPFHNTLLLKACRLEPTERTPIWLMRQAGRYMKEYRELRAKVSFLELCKNSDLAAEVTVDAAQRLDVDAAIIFSDLLLPLEAMGFDLSYEKDEGPRIINPFRIEADLKRIKQVDPVDSLRFTLDAIRKTRKSLKPNIPLIGFVGAPFTLASYLIEGGGSKNFAATKKLMHGDSAIWNQLLEKMVKILIDYANEQLKAGSQVIQVFDSWAGALTGEDYRKFAQPFTKRLIEGITPGIPVISFGTQTGGFLKTFSQAGGDVIGVDWRVELDEAWNQVGSKAIMGNLDPTVLLTTPKEIEQQAQRILNQAANRPGHIFNLGHGVLPETPIENVLALVEAVKRLSKRK